MPLIKRYPNRKLYDTDAKRYVTLDEIADLIRQGHDVHVVDHESGDDLTNLTLTQIILEQEKKASGYLSRSLLTNLIRTGGSAIDQAWSTLRSSVSGLTTLDLLGRSRELESQINHLLEQGKLSMEQAQGLLHFDKRVEDFLHSLNVPTQRDLNELQEQFELLNKRLAELLEERSDEQSDEQLIVGQPFNRDESV